MIIKEDRAYVRVSTLKDSQKDSPEHQESLIREHAAREKTEISQVYEDRDTATSMIDRDDIQKMIADAKRGEIRSVWFVSLSRFSRDTIDALSIKRILVNALKIRVVSIEDGYDSKVKDDELMFGVRSVFNQNSSKDTGTASSRGIRKSALEDLNYIGTIPPFGYVKVMEIIGVVERKTLEYHPEQQLIVRMIGDLYIDGLGDKAIVKYLNGDNDAHTFYPSYDGGLWNLSSVQAILTNPIYTGYNVSGRYKTEIAYDDLTDMMNRRKKLVKQPKEKWEWSKRQAHPEIWSMEEYNEIQELRLIRGGGVRGGRRDFVNVFAKLIFCAECGSAIVTMVSRARGKSYRYLMCSRRRRMGETGCGNKKWIPYEDMRDELITEVLDRMKTNLSQKEKRLGSSSAGPTVNNFTKDKKKLEKKVDDNRNLLFEIRRQNMLGEIDNAQYAYEKGQYEKEITETEIRLASVMTDEKKSFNLEKIIKDAQKAISELTKLKSYDDIEKTRFVLQLSVKRIEVDKEGKIKVQVRLE